MSAQQSPLTYEGILELFRQTDLRFERMSQETDRKFQETAEQIRKTSQEGLWTKSTARLDAEDF